MSHCLISLAHSLPLCLRRSITVPYAYQCCAFVACDSAISAAEDDERRNAFGMTVIYTVMSSAHILTGRNATKWQAINAECLP